MKLWALLAAAGCVGEGAEAKWSQEMENSLVEKLEELMEPVQEKCITFESNGWWKYQWCHKKEIKQLHSEKNGRVTSEWSAGQLGSRETQVLWAVGNKGGVPEMLVYQYDQDGQLCHETGSGRKTEVRLACCSAAKKFQIKNRESMSVGDLARIISVEEVETCAYLMTVCSPVICWAKETWRSMIKTETPDLTNQSQEAIEKPDAEEDESRWTIRRESNDEELNKEDQEDHVEGRTLTLTENERLETLDQVKNAFYTGYNAYMTFAFPQDELKPISCTGEDFALTAGNMLTLIDSLDMLAIIGNHTEFARAVRLVAARSNFDLDVTVSVFETTIRILGGILSAHMLASDESLGIMPDYQGELLPVAADLGDRLLPAFLSNTSIPFGTVNLRHGVPPKETTEACTAAAGSLSLEFGMLSVLTGDPKYGVAARDALKAIFDHRSQLGLVGRHIDVQSGRWTEPTAGIGSNIDSLYEYYLKHYILFGDEEAYNMFQELYGAAVEHLRIEKTWYVEVNMHRGGIQRRQFNNLQAFWPGMQTLLGDLESATKTINAFLQVWNEFGFTPEDFNIDKWQPLSGGTRRGYPLRPELAESVYYTMLATEDPSWLVAGRDMIRSIEQTCLVKCGYASVMDIKTERLHDTMPSFFLSEMLKYLYLLFDTDNFVREDRGGNYIFTTEAHPFPIRSDIQKKALEMGFAFPSSKSFERVRAEAQERIGSSIINDKRKTEEEKYKRRVRDLWGVQSISAEMTAERQCPALLLDTWEREDPFIEAYYGSDLELRKPRRSGFTSSSERQGNSASPSTLKQQNSAIPEIAPGKPFEMGGLPDGSVVSVKATDYGFHLEHKSTNTELEINSLGGTIVGAKLSNLEQWSYPRYIFLNAEEPNNVVRCFLTLTLGDINGGSTEKTCQESTEQDLHESSNDAVTLPAESLPVESPEQDLQGSSIDAMPFPFKAGDQIPCSISEFGPPGFDMGSFEGQVVLAESKTGCTSKAFPKQKVKGKFVLVHRGDCMFEQKARLAEGAGAIGVIVIQNEDAKPVFYMVGMGSTMAAIQETLKMRHVRIPAFMIERQDGIALEEALAETQQQETVVLVKAKVEHVPQKTDVFPWGRFETKSLAVYASSQWGVRLVADKDTRWLIELIQPTP